MKKIFLIIMLIVLVLCGCDTQQTESAIPTINKTELTLTVGQSERLTVSNAKNVEWSSSDSKIVRVYYGAVTALSEGTATITADIGSEKFVCNVTVNKNDDTSTENHEETTSSSKPSLPQDTTAESSSTDIIVSNDEDYQSTPTHEENVEASERAVFELVERLTDEKYDKAIADLTKECNDIIDGYKKELAEKQARLEIVGEDTAEGFFLKDSIKVLNESISNTKKILSDGIDSLERQRQEEHANNKEEFGTD